ncbi:MAG: hypothetical protein AAGG51_24380 [Cyanobacteria bacterium P01_G01_bin.54]
MAQVLLMPNGLVGWAGLLVFALFCGVRICQEETLMLEQLSETYGDYRQAMGAIVPGCFRLPWVRASE